LIFILTIMIIFTQGYADGLNSLKLTEDEMKKLKKYFPAEENSSFIWKGDAISIELPIGKEKRIIFPNYVAVDFKGALKESQLKIINNDKSLYLTALKSFPMTRMYVTVLNADKVILIDIIPTELASTRTDTIELDQKPKTAPSLVHARSISNLSVDERNTAGSQTDANTTYVDLIRYAWIQKYALTKIVNQQPQYPRTAMQTQEFVSDLIYGDKTIAVPEASWLIANHYVTVVSLQNKYQHKTHIDLRTDLCGHWQAANLYPRSILSPKGTEKDSTVLILVSKKSFGKSVGVCHGEA